MTINYFLSLQFTVNRKQSGEGRGGPLAASFCCFSSKVTIKNKVWGVWAYQNKNSSKT